MPSGKQSKRRRAADESTPPAPRRASPTVLIIAGVVLALVVIGIVLGVVLTRDSSSGNEVASDALPGAGAVEVTFRGIPQEGQVLGSPDAPVTMVEYVDIQCPYCMDFETQALPKIIDSYVRSGKLKLDMRMIAALGPDSERGRAAVLAAALQNRMFNLTQLLYKNQGEENTGWLTDALIESAASSIPGLDVDQLLADRDSTEVADMVTQIEDGARADGVQVTPTVLVGKTGGTLKQVQLLSSVDSNSVAKAVDAALGQG